MTKGAQKGFSLFEVLIVLFLIASVMGLVVANFDNIIKGLEEKDLRQQFFRALRETRYQAGFSKDVCTLTFENNGFVVKDAKGNKLGTFLAEVQDSEVYFKKILPNEDPSAPLSLEPEENTQSSIVISSFGCSTPVEVNLKAGTREDKFLLDPFSSAILPNAKDREPEENK